MLVRSLTFTIMTLVAAVQHLACAPPPPPAGAPKVVAVIYCREIRHQPPPPFGDGSAFTVYFWQWISQSDGAFTLHDNFSGYDNNTIARANVAYWQKALGSWSINWWATPDGSSRALLLTVAPPADPNTVPVCTWLAPPV